MGIKLVISLLPLFHVIACSQTVSHTEVTSITTPPKSMITDQATLNGKSIRLASDANKCVLFSDSSSSPNKLALLPPCYFMRTQTGELKQYAYKDVGIDAVVIVVGNPISDGKRDKWGLNAEQRCGEKRLALLATNTGIKISAKTLEGGVSCVESGNDEKDYWYFAH